MALTVTGDNSPSKQSKEFDKSFAVQLLITTDKPDFRAFHDYLLTLDQGEHDEGIAFLQDQGLAADYQGFLDAQDAAPSDLETYLQNTDPSQLDFAKIENAGFNALKTIEHRNPALIKKVQTALEENGQYVTEPGHRFYRDGKIGRESTSVTWHGIKSAARQDLNLAKETISHAGTAERLSEIDQLKTQISLNSNALEKSAPTSNVGSNFSAAHAQDLMATVSPDNIGKGAMRVLDKADLDEGTLETWIGDNQHASEMLSYIRENPEISGSFDYAAGTATAETLLTLIRQHEATGSYDVAWSHQPVIYKGETRMPTDMTIGEVLDWQKNYCPRASHAIGGYQMMDFTLAEYSAKAGFDLNTKFTPEVQDQIAMTILIEKRGMGDFLKGRISTEAFINNLAHEWAILPKDRNGGAYDHTRLNQANTEIYDTLQSVVTDMRKNYQQAQNPTVASTKDLGASEKKQTPEAASANGRAQFTSAANAQIAPEPVDPAPTPKKTPALMG